MPMIDRRVALLVSAILLAGCAAPGPAPVESRTRPPAAVVRPAAPQQVPPLVAPATRPPAGTAEQPATAEVQAAPVRSSGLQVRPLETVPAPPAGPAPRTGPVGVRQPYSDSALAAMRDPARTASASAPAATGAAAAGAGAATPSAASAPAASSAQPPATAPAPRSDPPPAAAPSAVSAAGFAWPARGRVIQGFSAPQRMGILIAGQPGDPVSAAADGRVIFSGPGPRGYGNLVIVRHEGDTLSVYAHNRSLAVKEGDAVRRGQKIAEIGATGTDSPKLHFEIRQAGRPVDPMRLLPPR